MLGALLFGFLLGMRHALEADHLAAVAALATRTPSPAARVRLASAWGAGHAATLWLLGGTVLALGHTLPERVAATLEAAVGVVLVALGLDLLRQLRRRRVHLHAHRHGGGPAHVHAHAHADGDGGLEPSHAHAHPARLVPRALAVGSLHGLAGSAGLVVVSMELTRSVPQALGYLGAFGLGSVAGMAALAAVVSLPLCGAAAGLGAAARVVQGAIGVVTVALGCWTALGPLLP